MCVCLFVCHRLWSFPQGYLHWGQSYYAYWCFDQKIKNSCFDQKRTSFISDLGAVTVVSGSQILMIFTKLDQFHQRVRGGNCGFRVPKMGSFLQSVLLASIWRGHLRRFAPRLCRVLSRSSIQYNIMSTINLSEKETANHSFSSDILDNTLQSRGANRLGWPRQIDARSTDCQNGSIFYPETTVTTPTRWWNWSSLVKIIKI